MSAPERLCARTLEGAYASIPHYDRTQPPSIVHIGVGAFARAHVAVYADDLLTQGWPATITGVSLRSARSEEQLAPQDGLYTVVERDPSTDAPLRVIGSLTSVRTGVETAIEHVARPSTSLVTLTITENGYEPGPGSAAEVLAIALARRRAAAQSAPVVASLDNLLGNGDLLRSRVLDAAAPLDDGLPEWIAAHVPFANSVVDRIVPATTEADRAETARRLGLVDLAPVCSEHYRSWVIGEVDGLPPLADAGVQVVRDVSPYEHRKLWLLNGPHSALAYCGLLAGCTTIAEAVTHTTVGRFVRLLVDDVLAAADLPASLAPAAFATDTLRRFGNPALGHTCVQVGTDGSRKLPQRYPDLILARRKHGLPTTRFAVVVAAWIAAVTALPVRGVVLPAVEDPAAHDLRAALASGGLDAVSRMALSGADAVFAGEVRDALERLQRDGAAVLEASA